ncbi:MAG: hypothetical protein IJ584_16950 [Bacteroidales bacterium]|nr:hypothetical protein [Bacteroidales bacterium]
MKKVVVFKVDNVLVGEYDERREDEGNGRKMVRRIVGDEVFGKEFMKEGKKGERVVMSFGEMREKVSELRKRDEVLGEEIEKRMDEWERRREERLEEMRRGYVEEKFEKRGVRGREDLLVLEKILSVKGGRMVFVSGERKVRVENLLRKNGLERFEVEKDMDFLKGENEEDVVVFGKVKDMKDLWGKVGLRRA